MENDRRYLNTGSYPILNNTHSTAKDFSTQETTNPQGGLLDIMSNLEYVDDETLREIIDLNKSNLDQSNTFSSK